MSDQNNEVKTVKTPGYLRAHGKSFAKRVAERRQRGHLQAECDAFTAAKPSDKRSARMRAFGRTDGLFGRKRGVEIRAISDKAADLYAEGWHDGDAQRQKVKSARNKLVK